MSHADLCVAYFEVVLAPLGATEGQASVPGKRSRLRGGPQMNNLPVLATKRHAKRLKSSFDAVLYCVLTGPGKILFLIG